MTWSAHVSAAGIGGINVISALGQPLKADIELVSVSQAEKTSLVARLATPEAYKAAGLDYPFGNKFKFAIENRADGESYIHATSAQSINDPFVSLLVELSWSSGKLVREFTFLLDPVGYQAEQPVAQPVQAVAPVVVPVAKPIAESAPVQPAVEPVAVPPAESAAVVSTPIEKAVEQPAQQKSTQKKSAQGATKQVTAEKAMVSGDVTVQHGDTLNKIAAANKADGVSLERMLVALYRANVSQFDGRNMNRIQTGKILRLPNATELAALNQSDAKKEIHIQVSDWNAYRQKLASAAPLGTQQQAAQQVSAGKISSTVADKTPVAKESAKEVLKLSKGDALTDKVAATGKATSQDKKNAVQEEAIAKAKAAEEERTRAALLEKNLQDMKHLAELKTQAAALAQAASATKMAVASQVAAVSQVTAVSAVSAVSAASAALPVPKHAPKPLPKPVVAEASMMDQVLADPVYLGGGAAVLLGLGGLAFAVSRRKNKQNGAGKTPVEDIGSVTGHIATPVMPSPDTGDFTIQAGSTQTVAPSSSDDDPISEADLFLSFGRDAQAEEILKEALATSSNKTPIKMKLLEIYAARKDTGSFAATAEPMKDVVDDKTWQQVASMGLKVDPQNTLYGGVASVEDSDSATMQTLALSATPDLTGKTLTRSTDFDVSDPATMVEKTMIFSADEIATAKNSVMDFDVTATNPSIAAPTGMDFDVTANPANTGGTDKKEASSGLDDLVFDVTSTHPSMPAATEEVVAVTKHDDDGMFTLDFPIEPGASNADGAAKPAEFNLSDISLNLDDDKPVVKPAAESAQWHEVATKLDLARAYQEMGDDGGAKEILDEVLHEGDAEQRAAAQEILKQLG